MTDLKLTAFVTDSGSIEADIQARDLELLLETLIHSEHPRSYRVLFWLMLRTLQSHPELLADIVEAWMPSESDLAQLLEDAGLDGTQTVLTLRDFKSLAERLWELCDDIGAEHLPGLGDPWASVSLAPMAALYAERQLDELIATVSRGKQWKDPAEVLSPSGESEFDLEAILALAHARMAKTSGSEALNIVILRLLNVADRVN